MSFSEITVILLSTILVNNFVLAQFLGLCPFMGVSNKLESAIGMAGATTFVMTLASICTYLVSAWVLAQRSVVHWSQMLEIVAAQGQNVPTYKRDRKLRSRGALMDREA